MLSADWVSVYVNAAAAIGTIGAFVVGFVLFRGEHHREEDRSEAARRSQAVKVSAWVEAQRTAQGGRELLFFVHNASDMPIYEVSLPSPDEERAEAEFIGLVPPGQTIQRPAPRSWLATYYAPEPVEIEFVDSGGRQWTQWPCVKTVSRGSRVAFSQVAVLRLTLTQGHWQWTRDEQGVLVPTDRNPPEPPTRRRFMPFRGAR